ncbi:hypothetical protein NDU88_010574 [Pleurodeles waltl]|uniref:Uncharacterized protein n=1 Tax=Pleurodeles waltl TaxID=8319 RepID=A0AAV7R0L6_PLEWA|nr:hypothetical protein NDU88_010574 [Pleurodeles waltl]
MNRNPRDPYQVSFEVILWTPRREGSGQESVEPICMFLLTRGVGRTSAHFVTGDGSAPIRGVSGTLVHVRSVEGTESGERCALVAVCEQNDIVST